MPDPKKPDPASPATAPEVAVLERIPATLRKVLRETPENEWHRIRFFVVDSEEEGQIVDMLPKLKRVMRVCPGKLLGKVGKREVAAEQVTQKYCALHDGMNTVDQSLDELLRLAGYQDYSHMAGAGPAAKAPPTHRAAGETKPAAEGEVPKVALQPAKAPVRATA